MKFLKSLVLVLGVASVSEARPHLFARRCQPCQQQQAQQYQPVPVVQYQPGPVVQAVGQVVYSVGQVPAAVGQRVSQCVNGTCPVQR